MLIANAVRMLRTDPLGFPNRAASAAAEKLRLYRFRHESSRDRYVAHYGVHRNGNAGDTALFTATRKLFEHTVGQDRWRKLPVRAPVAAGDIEILNRNARAVLVGGGGLIIPDSVPNSKSGWQWNLPVESLRQLEVPLILNAVGYNSFHGQEAFSAKFSDHIVETIDRAKFVGLRNTGSIKALSPHLPDDLAAKLRFQPCPTTVLSRIYPEFDRAWEPGKHLSINLAFDRPEKRFSGPIEESIREIADAASHMVSKGWRATVAIHDPRDRFYLPLLKSFGLSFETVDLAHRSIPAIYEHYCSTDLTIGMRGHGQMIPFGLQRPIFTLASHPKMTYFLEDIGHEDWGVDIREPGFRDRLVAGMEDVASDPSRTRQHLKDAQDKLWATMLENVDTIAASMT